MHALSEAQFRAAIGGGIPEPEPIAERLWSLPMAMPGDFLAYTLAAVQVGASGAVTVIDPGWGSDAALDRIDGFLVSIGRSLVDVRTVVVTHSHPDHIGLAGSLRDATGAMFVLSAREQASIDAFSRPDAGETEAMLRGWGVGDETAALLRGRLRAAASGAARPARADLLVEDGDRLPVDGEDWRALITPGHTPGHMCIVDAGRRILFSGDHVLPTVFPGLGLGSAFDGNPLDAYLRSLERLRPCDDFEVVPGHGYRFRGLHARRRKAADHALRRAREVAAITAAEPDASTWDVASRLTWTGGWEQLSDSVMLYSALLQTDIYREFTDAGGLQAHAADL
jgi:glyoxylase-like metal-dependent hydrolase (beta-lactamase superfamily II)